MQGAVYKDLAAGGPVGEFQLLVGAEEVDGVGARHGAAPQGVDADLVLPPLAAVPLPAIHRGQGVGGVDGLQQQLCGAAGCVGLLVVVGLGDLNVKIRLQHAGDHLQRPVQHRDAQRKIGAPQHGGIGAQALQLPLLGGGIAGGAGQQGRAGTFHISADGRQCLGPGEVDDHVGHFPETGQLSQVIVTESGHNLVAARLGSGFYQPAHFSPADQQKSHSRPASFKLARRMAWCSSLISHRGSRMGPTFRPIMFMALLTGMGLTSINRSFISFKYFR